MSARSLEAYLRGVDAQAAAIVKRAIPTAIAPQQTTAPTPPIPVSVKDSPGDQSPEDAGDQAAAELSETDLAEAEMDAAAAAVGAQAVGPDEDWGASGGGGALFPLTSTPVVQPAAPAAVPSPKAAPGTTGTTPVPGQAAAVLKSPVVAPAQVSKAISSPAKLQPFSPAPAPRTVTQTKVAQPAPAPRPPSLLTPFQRIAAARPTAAPRIATRLSGDGQRTVASEIAGVSDEEWTEFVVAMRTAQPSAVSASNALGAFEIKPRRLADLGIVENVSLTRAPGGRMVWIGEFIAPQTHRGFLGDLKAQYRAFSDSMRGYVAAMRDGSVPRPDGGMPQEMSLSGALAVLHRCGPSGLKTWNDVDCRFPETTALYERVNGIF